MKNSSVNNPLKKFVNLLLRYNFVIFVSMLSVGLIVSVIILTNILTEPYTEDENLNPTGPTFDQSTIIRLDKLETSASNKSYKTMPSGRADLFSE